MKIKVLFSAIGIIALMEVSLVSYALSLTGTSSTAWLQKNKHYLALGVLVSVFTAFAAYLLLLFVAPKVGVGRNLRVGMYFFGFLLILALYRYDGGATLEHHGKYNRAAWLLLFVILLALFHSMRVVYFLIGPKKSAWLLVCLLLMLLWYFVAQMSHGRTQWKKGLLNTRLEDPPDPETTKLRGENNNTVCNIEVPFLPLEDLPPEGLMNLWNLFRPACPEVLQFATLSQEGVLSVDCNPRDKPKYTVLPQTHDVPLAGRNFPELQEWVYEHTIGPLPFTTAQGRSDGNRRKNTVLLHSDAESVIVSCGGTASSGELLLVRVARKKDVVYRVEQQRRNRLLAVSLGRRSLSQRNLKTHRQQHIKNTWNNNATKTSGREAASARAHSSVSQGNNNSTANKALAVPPSSLGNWLPLAPKRQWLFNALQKAKGKATQQSTRGKRSTRFATRTTARRQSPSYHRNGDGHKIRHNERHKKKAGMESRVNVMVVYLDAVSRRMFHRKFPKTVRFLEETMEGNVSSVFQTGVRNIFLHDQPNQVSLKFFRYHSSGRYTQKNAPQMFTGMYTTKLLQNSTLGEYRPVWEAYRDQGYVTATVDNSCQDWFYKYARGKDVVDQRLMSPFCLKDYYNPGAEHSHFNGPFSMFRRCLKGKNVHEYVFEYLHKFWKEAYPDESKFAAGFFTEAHEPTGEVIKYVDEDLERFLRNTIDLDNTIVYIVSDHGQHTLWTGALGAPSHLLENKLPLWHMMVPRCILDNAPQIREMLEHNQQSLVTGMEMHQSLLSILGVKPAKAYPRGETKVFDVFTEFVPQVGMVDGMKCCKGKIHTYCACNNMYRYQLGTIRLP